MLEVLVLAAVIAGGYWGSLRLWPWRPCRRCDGGGRNAGSNRRRFGTCPACGGSGRKLRLGARMIERRKR